MPLVVVLFNRLLRGQDFNEATTELVEAVGAADVAMQAGRLKLRQYADRFDISVDIVKYGEVDKAILAGKRHGRLCAVDGERQQPSATSAPQDQCHDVSHQLLPY